MHLGKKNISKLGTIYECRAESAIYRNKMMYNNTRKNNGSRNWEAYRRQRNYVTKLKNKSMNPDFLIDSLSTSIYFVRYGVPSDTCQNKKIKKPEKFVSHSVY